MLRTALTALAALATVVAGAPVPDAALDPRQAVVINGRGTAYILFDNAPCLTSPWPTAPRRGYLPKDRIIHIDCMTTSNNEKWLYYKAQRCYVKAKYTLPDEVPRCKSNPNCPNGGQCAV